MTEPSQPVWVAETRFSGVIARLRLPRKSVEALLPPAVCLDESASSATASLLVAFGNHAAPAIHMAAMRLRTGVRFHEVLFGVRCRLAASRASMLFVPLMYCDEPVSTWTGNTLYGFNKCAASMEWLGSTFVVTDDVTKEMVCRAVVTPRRAGCPDGGNVIDGQPVRVLGRRPGDAYVTSHFDWDWTSVHRRPVHVLMVFGESAIPAATAIEVEGLCWRISWPEPCHSLHIEGPSASRDVTIGRIAL